MNKLFLLFLFPLALFGQLSPSCPSSVVAGQTLNCSINSSGGSPVDLQLVLIFPASLGAPTVTAGNSVVAAQKQVACGPAFLCLAYGMNAIAMQPGEIFHLAFNVPSNLTGNVTIGASNPVESDGGGNPLVVVVNPSVPVFIFPNISRCDINGDGQIDSSDVAAMVDSIDGANIIVRDLNGDLVANVLDLQLVINAANGLGCAAH